MDEMIISDSVHAGFQLWCCKHKQNSDEQIGRTKPECLKGSKIEEDKH